MNDANLVLGTIEAPTHFYFFLLTIKNIVRSVPTENQGIGMKKQESLER